MSETVTLRIKERYRNGRVDWAAGRIDQFTPVQAKHLMTDAPGVFEVLDSEAIEAAEAAKEAVLVEAFGENQEVVVESPEEVQPEGAVDEDSGVGEVDLESMSLPEIREYAAAQSISVQGLRRKDDLIAAIRGE